ncbi:AIR synthase related protein [Alkalithermobacter paradoxus]|uniref:PurM-like N-terminal domain-containing protein n=1 Tax=Alkalithermobacter paradoxus TaxID=29349 RepID=A0A1V4I3W0_9FIRM|nr:hypothetical protein CLOTH_20340 [[Clostridium] thermoalcaliphilum]
MKKYRDLLFLDINDKEYLVISCDSCCGVGLKKFDKVKAPYELVSYFTTRVCMMELMSIKGNPIAIVDNLGTSMEKGGNEIINGIKKFLRENEIDIPITGSTEENFISLQTFLGLTVIGRVDKDYEKYNKPRENDLIVVLGIPKVGSEIDIQTDKEIISFDDFRKIINLEYINCIIPVGSKGIKYESEVMSKIGNLNIEYIESNIDISKSAGPSTCVIAAINEENLSKLKNSIKCPINIIGKFFS